MIFDFLLTCLLLIRVLLPALNLAFKPDRRHPPQHSLNDNANPFDQDVRIINPDEVFNISYVLIEKSLHLQGNHLGSIWLRPDPAINNDLYIGLEQSTVGYPTRPIQLAKILNESSVILKDCNGDPAIANRVASGVELSCPIFDQNKRRTKHFCYILEIKRSPFMQTRHKSDALKSVADSSGDMSSPVRIKGLMNAKNLFSKQNNPVGKTEIEHSPIAYSLVIHPPIIIENLLPERGRFELMNATSKEVMFLLSKLVTFPGES